MTEGLRRHGRIGVLLAAVVLAVASAVPVEAQEAPGVSLRASQRAIEFGSSVRLSGEISPPAEGETISIIDELGQERASTTTDASGAYSVRISPRTTGSFQARWLAAVSEPVTVKVRPKVRVSLRAVRLFGKARIVGSIRPAQDSGRVSLKLFRSGRKQWERKVALSGGDRFRATFSVAKPGGYRVKASFTDPHGATGRDRSTSRTTATPSLAPGSTDAHVLLLERRLRELGYHLDGTDRNYSEHTADAMRAFNKVEGRARLGTVDRATWFALASARRARARYDTRGFHLEVDQTRQVLLTVRDGRVERVIHVSTGRDGYTPDGTWRIYRKIAGYSGGRLYYPSYYEGRRALHGWPEVPTYNASHGCTRLPMWTAQWVYGQAKMGTIVHIYH